MAWLGPNVFANVYASAHFPVMAFPFCHQTNGTFTRHTFVHVFNDNRHEINWQIGAISFFLAIK